MTRFEALNPACRGMLTVKIFACVSLGARRGRQALALDRQQRAIFRELAAFDPERRAARRGHEIDRALRRFLIWLLALELQEVPAAVQARAIEPRTELRAEGSLACMHR